MKRLTLRQSLEAHVAMWDWLADNPGKWKEDWPGWGNYEHKFRYRCFACDYDFYRTDKKRCINGHCIIPIFRKNIKDSTRACEQEGSPYELWICGNGYELESNFAKQVANSGREALKEPCCGGDK